METSATRRNRLDDLLRQFDESMIYSNLDAEIEFNRVVDDHARGLPTADRVRLFCVRERSTRALESGRAGKLATMDQFLGETAVAMRPLEGLAVLLARSMYWSVQAYRQYLRGQFEDARNALRRANIADLRLMKQGVAIMAMHRLQLVHNLARIEIKRGDVNLASDYARAVIDHLRGLETADLPLAGPWQPAQLESCSLEVVAAMIRQIRGLVLN